MINRMTREDFREVIKFLEQAPVTLAAAFQQLSPADLKLKESDEFSALESICHLRDIEIEGYAERIGRILKEDNPSLADIDGARLAVERDYNNADGEAALAAFSAARRKNVELLRDLSPEQVAREGTLQGVGVISLEQLIEMMLEHDEGHLAEMTMIARRLQRRSETSAI